MKLSLPLNLCKTVPVPTHSGKKKMTHTVPCLCQRAKVADGDSQRVLSFNELRFYCYIRLIKK